ncbi:MAG: aldolase [Alphaproteobacteria bacterium]|nr:aldolase [Alphaproteobacteria bacterium]
MLDPVANARIDLAAALRLADRFGLSEGVCNHFSFQLPGTPVRYLINPNRMHWSEVTASGLILLDADGMVLEGDGPPEATAFFIHSCIHKANPAAACVLHTHMPYATAITSLEGGELTMTTQNALRFSEEIAYDTTYNGLACDDEEGARIAAAFQNKRIMFMANHGVAVAAPTVAEAFDDLYYLERAAENQVLAMSTGRSLKPIDPQVVAMTKEQIDSEKGLAARAHFEALKRILDRECPDYRH